MDLTSESSLLPNDHYNNVNEYISAIGMGSYQYKLFALCGMGWAADNMWFQALAVILPLVKMEFKLEGWSVGICTSSTHIGAMIGAASWGYISDKAGRKPAFLMTLTLTIFGGLLAAFSDSLIRLCLSLVLLGFGVGGNLPVDGALFLEFIPKENQSLLALLSVFWPVGHMTTSLVGLIFIPNHECDPNFDCLPENNMGWRYTLFGLASITTIMLLLRFVLFSFHESPKNLLARGRHEEALHVIRELAIMNNVEIFVTDSNFLLVDETRYEIANNDIGYQLLLQKSILPSFVMVFLIWTLISIAYTTFNGFLVQLLKNSANENGQPAVDVWKNYFIIATAGIPGSFAAKYLSDGKLGRRGTLALATFGTAVSLYLFTIFTSPNGHLASSCMISYLQNIMYGVLYTYSPEVFPTYVRGMAVGLLSAGSRLFGSLTPLTTGYLLAMTLNLPLYIASILLLICSIIILLLPIETSGVAAL